MHATQASGAPPKLTLTSQVTIAFYMKVDMLEFNTIAAT